VAVPVLLLDGITKKFPGTVALDGVSFKAYSGEVSALVGANGAGKSTLIKIVSGAIHKDSGSVQINGEEVDIQDPQSAQELGISVIYQDFSVLTNLTIAENIFLGREFSKGQLLDNRLQSEEAKKMLRIVGLDGYNPETLVGELSNPEKQMVEFAKALSIKAKVILMDEPSAVLTEGELAHLYHQLEILKKQGIAIVFVSHRINEVLTVSDTITVLKDGKNADYMTKSEASHARIVTAMCGKNINREPLLAKRKTEAEPSLVIEDLRMGTLVNGVNLSVYGGEIVGLAGLVGSGRTETALCVFGARKADSGNVFVRGKKANFKHPGEAVAESIGLVPEDRKEQGVLGMLNVCSNISLANLQHFVNFGFIKSKSEFKNAEDMVEAMKIRTPSILQSLSNLSGGNQQKVVLGKWLTRESKILILDEPTQGIDVGARDEIYQILRRLAEDGKAVLLISSDLGEVMRVCDRVLVMYKGTIVKEFMNCEATHEELLLYCTGGGKRNDAGKS